MEAFKKFMRQVAKIEGYVLAVMMIVILVLTFANVVGRFVFNHSLAFADELVVALFVLVSLVGAALCAREDDGLVGLSLVSDSLKGKAKTSQKMIANLVSIIYCLVLFWQGIERTATDFTQKTNTFVLHWPRWIFWAFVPISAFFLVLHFVENTVIFIGEVKEGNK